MKKLINKKGAIAGYVVLVIYVMVHSIIMSNSKDIYIHMMLRRFEMVNPSVWTLFVYNVKAIGINLFTNDLIAYGIITLVSAYTMMCIATYKSN
jgi:hypothetical protein